jgi:hypothetical protein
VVVIDRMTAQKLLKPSFEHRFMATGVMNVLQSCRVNSVEGFERPNPIGGMAR